MKHYQSKDELISAIQNAYEKYIAEFQAVPEQLKDKKVENVDRTPAENLVYQLGWTTLLLKWEADERAGLEVKTPSDQFKWNQLGQLYQWFNEAYSHQSLEELENQLTENVTSICNWIAALPSEVLFEPHQRQWADQATKTATWEVYKFIHINTVAPFTTFRTKIRKWKKQAL